MHPSTLAPALIPHRNLLAYGIRMGMYLGMGFLLATIWVKLGNSDSKINDRLSVHFFSVAFLAFMSVAGIPACTSFAGPVLSGASS